MYFGKKTKFDWTFAVIVSDILALLCAFLIEGAFHAVRFHSLFHYGGVLGALQLFVLGLMTLYGMRYFGLYTWSVITQRAGAPALIMIAAILMGILFAGIQQIFLEPISKIERRDLELVIFFEAALIWGFRLVLRFLVRDVLRLIPEERIVFIGWSPRIERVLRTYVADVSQLQNVLGFVYEGGHPEREIPFEKGFKPLGLIAEIEKILGREKATLVLVDEACLELAEINQISEICSRCFVNLKVIPSAFDILAGKLTVRVVAGVPLLGVAGLRHDRYHNKLAKRAVDIAGSLAGLLLAGPVIIVCAFLIKRESPGPAFYRQVRLGMRGRKFEMIKLRTMRLDAEKESGPKWAIANDNRRLRIGAFLRSWNIDETPQFWNILKGDMSLVGPRPERPEFVENFQNTIRHYNLRHSCRPGLTGWAAVNGLRGNTSLIDRLEYDLFYIENWSLLFDFQIMAMTLYPPKNAY